jgi:SAM-dependent methyltransferase
VTEHICDESKILLLADRTTRLGLRADVRRRPDEFGVGVTHLVSSKPADAHLIDEHAPCEAVVDDASPLRSASQAPHREICRRHGRRIPLDLPARPTAIRVDRCADHHTGHMSNDHRSIRLGRLGPDEVGRRIVGDPARVGRVLELGVGPHRNALVPASLGVKAIAVDPDASKITDLRERAAQLDAVVECHHAELGDLGFAISSSVDLVIADGTLDDHDDLSRVLRQVHRVLRAGRALVIATVHPMAGVTSTDPSSGRVAVPYGQAGRTISDWFDALRRANFDVDLVREFGVGPQQPVPHSMVIRAHKLGD